MGVKPRFTALRTRDQMNRLGTPGAQEASTMTMTSRGGPTGASIGIGAGIGGGLGLIAAMLLAVDLPLGLVFGAAAGVLVGLAVETIAGARRELP